MSDEKKADRIAPVLRALYKQAKKHGLGKLIIREGVVIQGKPKSKYKLDGEFLEKVKEKMKEKDAPR